MHVPDNLPDLAAPIVLFDGVCNFCNGSVNWVIDRDRAKRVRFASFQSPAGQVILRHFGMPLDRFDSVVLIEDGKAFSMSDAAIRITRHLPRPWRWTMALLIVPRPLRDAVYGLIARNRYRWFGASESCRMPGPEFEGRFIELDVPEAP